jgi:cell division septation protein DedD
MMTRVKQRLSGAALTALAMLVLPMGVDAQVQQQDAPDPPDREELTEFVKAYIDVQEIQMEMEQALATVQDPEDANRIQQEANEAMAEAIQDNDLSVERYSEIVMALNTDEELRQEFAELYEEILEDRGGAWL